MATNVSRITISGGAPWGFRLFGGDDEPLVIAKIRKRSKAADAGLQEGDVLLVVNDYSCHSLNHPTVMALIEQSGPEIHFDILRGTVDNYAVEQAFNELGPNLKQLGPDMIKTPQALQQPESQPEEMFHSGQGPNLSSYPGQEQHGTRPHPAHRPVETLASKPSVWKPSGAPKAAGFKVEAPSGVEVHHHSDKSVTMAFDIGGAWNKENRPAQAGTNPVPQFHVRKIVPKTLYQSSSAFAQIQLQPTEHKQQLSPPQLYNGGFNDTQDGGEDYREHLKKVFYHGVFTEGGSESESGGDSPTAWFRSKRKIYADSAFYDDPEHKYPTIEEQIKMARKVAISLESPANRRARGHKMFMKRKMKSDYWSTEFAGESIADAPGKVFDNTDIPMPEAREDEDKYYQPNPWSGQHTWTPPSQRSPSPKKHQVTSPPAPYIPPPPPLPTFIPPAPKYIPPAPKYMAPKLPGHLDSEKTRAMSADEFEKVRLYGQKTHHDTLPPSVAFSLAEDLRQMKGKGGRMFAKRQARSEKWVVGEGDKTDHPNANVMQKIMTQAAMEYSDPGRGPPRPKSTPPPALFDGGVSHPGMPINRLKEMIDPPKPACTPWDAAAHYGDLEKAFQHLDGYMGVKKGNFKQQISKNLEKAAERSYMTPYRPEPVGLPVNRSVEVHSTLPRNWQDSGDMSRSYDTLPLPGKSKDKGYRQIRFKAANNPSSKVGMFDSGPPLWKISGQVTPSGINQEGVSDL